MEEITSVNNQLVKDTARLLQKKYRDSEGLFLLEGYKSIDEAVRAGINIKYIFILKENASKYDFFDGRKIHTTDAVLNKLSAADTAPDAVGVAVQKQYFKNDFSGLNKVILLENIKDLGNLGTIIRTAVAFGVQGIILYGNCADLYNPKCVRSSVGNLWKIPILHISSFSDLKEMFADYQRVATLPLAKTYLKDFEFSYKTLVMFGSEADGLSDELVKFSTNTLKIEMSESVESLNLAVSCAVVMYNMLH